MPLPVSHAGQPPAPPVVPASAGSGEEPGAAAIGPGIGVPVSVWPHAQAGGSPDPGPAPAPCASCAEKISGPDATQIIAAFSRPGELVVIPDAQAGVVVAAAAATGRRVLGLAADSRSYERVLSCLDCHLDPAFRPLARVRPGGPAVLLEAGSPEAGQAALVITGSGGPVLPGTAESAAGAGPLYAACQRVLRPGGVLAVVTAGTPWCGRMRDHLGDAIAGARAAGLVYAQHIVALHAAVRDSQIIPGPSEAGRPPAVGVAVSLAPVHVRIHSDLLVFVKPGKEPRDD